MEYYSTYNKDNVSFSSDFLAIIITFQTRVTIIGWGVSEKIRSWNFWKIIEGGHQDFLIEMEGVSIEGGQKHCFLLMVYGFCSNNALYSAILSVTMFIFLLNPFNTWDCYYFETNINLMCHIKVLLMKKEYCFAVSETWRNNFPSWVCFCVYLKFQWGDIVLKNNFEGWGS